jgi:hypothetical protein
VVRSVQDEVLAHDGQTNEAKISTGFRLRRSTDIDAGETRTTVSITFLSIPCAMKNLQGEETRQDLSRELQIDSLVTSMRCKAEACT